MASPEYYDFIEKVRSRPRPAPDAPIAALRESFDEIAARLQVPDGVAFDPVDAGGVAAEWAAATGGEADKVILYTHGGGYNIGSARTHRGLVGRLALAAGARALSLDYRLAPEHLCPAPVEDTVAAYRWLLQQGTAPEHIVLAGDSAGGGLVVSTLVALRDAGEALPAAGVCISPWTDLANTGESITTRVDVDPMVAPASVDAHAQRYVGPDGDLRDPHASPLYADLAGLPPLLVLVGTWEILYDDSTRLVERARAAGVDVTLEVGEEMLHIWPFFAGFFPEAQHAVDLMGAYIRNRLPG